GNAYLTSLLDTLSSSTLRARIWRGLSEEGATERSLTEHRMIVDALERRDAALVAAHATVHIDGVARWLRRAIGCLPPPRLQAVEQAAQREREALVGPGGGVARRALPHGCRDGRVPLGGRG